MTMKTAVFAVLFSFLGISFAQAPAEYPSKPVRIIVPLTPGSGADIAARIIAQQMSEAWKQPVIVENRPGAGGQIGTAAVVKAEGDGYTLLVQSSSHAANPAIYKTLQYDPVKDLSDVALLGKTPYVMVSSAYKDLRALIAAAKKTSDMPFASAGVGTSTHLAAEYLLSLAGVRMLHVPFKGSPDAIQDVMGGRSTFYMAPINVATPLVKDGRLSALGVSTRRRADVLPDVPSIAEQGLSDYDMTLWFGMWAPASTSHEILNKLNAGVNAIAQQPNVKEQFAKLGIQPQSMKREEFSKFVREETEIYRKIVKAAGIKPQ